MLYNIKNGKEVYKVISYKVDVLKALAEKGYTCNRMRKEKILSAKYKKGKKYHDGNDKYYMRYLTLPTVRYFAGGANG